MSDDVYTTDLLDELYKLRDADRERKTTAIHIVKGRDVPVQNSKMGALKWYMHPLFQHTSIRSLQVFVQELPPGGRSGREMFQGGRVMYVLEGKGYTTIDGVRNEWAADDVVMIPIRPNGVVYQHFNTDKDRPASFICAEANLVDTLGPELGTRMEILEPAPGYEEKEKK